MLLAALYGIIGGHCISTLVVEGRISAPLVTHPSWKLVHILLFVYWLSADLGMFVLARVVRQPDLQLAAGLGFVDLAAPALLGIVVASLGWIALVIGYLSTTKPLHIQPSRDF